MAWALAHGGFYITDGDNGHKLGNASEIEERPIIANTAFKVTEKSAPLGLRLLGEKSINYIAVGELRRFGYDCRRKSAKYR